MDSNMIWTFVGKSLVALSPLLFAALSWLSLRAAQLISAKIRNELVRGALLRIDDAVFAVASEVGLAAREEIKKAAADGVISLEDRTRIREVAVQAVLRSLGAKGAADASRALGLLNGELEGFVGTRINAALYHLPALRPNGAAT